MGSSQSAIVAAEHEAEVQSFQWDDPIIRRGGIFSFSFEEKSSQSFQEYAEKICFRMKANDEIVNDDDISYTTEETSPYKWKIRIVRNAGEDPICQLESPCDCDIGEYKVTIRSGDKVLASEKFLMLCNPWNQDDEAYMANEADREEYLLSAETIIYYGYANFIQQQKWLLHQYDKCTIKTLLLLLKKMDRSSRSSLYKFAREITTMVSAVDENGIIEFTKEKVFTDGINPVTWAGSKPILEKHIATEKPVKYGHGIAISGVLCSIFRLAGIGCRIVTCYDCAHDTDGTLDIEVYYDENYKLLMERSHDRVSTFHIWVECFMRFPSVEKYNGWQVCDATPKKTKDNEHLTCGPAPVAAVKNGDLKVGYETRHIFSRVKAKVIQMVLVNDRPKKFCEQDSIVGKKIVTKAVGSTNAVDIVDNYKNDAGSVKNKVTRINADISVAKKDFSEKLILIQNVAQKETIPIGTDLMLKVDLLNPCDKNLDVMLKCYVEQHPNILSGEIMSKLVSFRPKKPNKEIIKVEASSIFDKINSDSCSVLVQAFYANEGRFFAEELRYPIETPSINIVVANKFIVDKNCSVIVKMKNTFPFPIENVRVLLEMDFCDESKAEVIVKVNQNSMLNAKFDITPERAGSYDIRAMICGSNIPTFHEIKRVTIV